jgi:hypothetical protein
MSQTERQENKILRDDSYFILIGILAARRENVNKGKCVT